MLMFFFYFILLYVTLNNGIQIFETDLHYEMFGNVASMRDLFLKNSTDDRWTQTEQKLDHVTEFDFDISDMFHFNRSNLNKTFDLNEFDTINAEYKNSSHNYKNMTRRFAFYDYDDTDYGESVELYKKNLLLKILVQFVLHTRYEVGKALTQREKIRGDKRYRIGYLFSRLRRLKTEQLKLVGHSMVMNRTRHRDLFALMKLYERVVHFDVDMRDSVKLMREVYAEDAPYDNYVQSKSNKKGKKS